MRSLIPRICLAAILLLAFAFSVGASAQDAGPATTNTVYAGTGGLSLQVASPNVAINMGTGFLGIGAVVAQPVGQVIVGLAGTIDGFTLELAYERGFVVQGVAFQGRIGVLAGAKPKLLLGVGHNF